jgi:CheY-like chemotaxis protein
MFDEIARELGERALRKGLVLRVNKRRRPPLFALSDRTLLKRALSNLVGNAIKYTECGGVILGAVSLQSSIRIDVRDTGIGIPEEFQARIFDEYFRIENSGRDRRRGLGLGLSIVRRIEESLPDHRLSFRSRPGWGSRFSLEVPATAGPASESVSSVGLLTTSPVREILQGKYVVVVEDERLILDGLVEAIRHAGCLVEGVESAAAARALFADRDRCPDILVTDYQLKCGETALDIVAALRDRFEWASGTPVLFVTGELMNPITVPADFEGTYDVYYKPIDADALLCRLRDLVMSRSPESRPLGRSSPEGRRKPLARQIALRDASGSRR